MTPTIPVGVALSKFGKHWFETDFRYLLLEVLHWLPVASLAGILAGTASAALLVSLQWATEIREAHHWIIALLPLAGLFVGCLYHFWGKPVETGNNLILEEVHDPRAVLPLRMTPLILLGTALTHLFGGSAGREGTAIQTGASLSDQLTHLFRFEGKDRRLLLMAGISGGFGSVFGTPLAGAVFGMEVLAMGRLGYQAILPCFVSAFVGDYVTRAWGVHHTRYQVTESASLNPSHMLWAVAAGAAFGLVAMLFAEATHSLSKFAKERIRWAPARPAAGGIVVAAAVLMTGTTRFIGLGIPTIVESFAAKLPPYTFAAKFLFTVVTLGSGFKGGEVTPLFYIGSTLGNALSYSVPLPTSLLAAMGFVGVFAGAANTPIASSLMALELFGPEAGSFAAIACVASYLFSGHTGIYHAQRVGSSKHNALINREGYTLAKLARSHQEHTSDPLSIDTLQTLKDFTMNNLTVLRLYFCASRAVKHGSWWRRMLPQPLGVHLLKRAKSIGIEQALLHRIIGGYLKDQSLVFEGSAEIPTDTLPQCLELVGEDDLLKRYLADNKELLGNVRVLFLRGEEAAVEARIDEAELRETLALEHRNGGTKNKE